VRLQESVHYLLKRFAQTYALLSSTGWPRRRQG
jgi:hypothetical protein